ncbi:MAG: hypothetical protein ACLP8Y_09350 [Thermoplasmata archaeon]
MEAKEEKVVAEFYRRFFEQALLALLRDDPHIKVKFNASPAKYQEEITAEVQRRAAKLGRAVARELRGRRLEPDSEKAELAAAIRRVLQSENA